MTQDKRIEEAAIHYKRFMDAIGIQEDANSLRTPYRVAKMMVTERCAGLYIEPPELAFFPKEGYDEYVVIKDIPYYSMCSHHHVSFHGKAHIAYHPKNSVVGISKFARVVTYFASKPQIQEALTTEILNYIWDNIEPIGLIVKVEGTHLCMCARGAKAEGSVTITQAIKGGIDKREVDNLFKTCS